MENQDYNYLIPVELELGLNLAIECTVNLRKILFKIPGKKVTPCAKNKRPKSKFHPDKRARYDEDLVLEGTIANSVSNHVEDDNQAVTLEEDTDNQSTISETTIVSDLSEGDNVDSHCWCKRKI